MSWQIFLVLASAHFVALISPGPDFFLLLTHTFSHGLKAGVYTAFGIALANGVFIIAALLGLRFLEAHPLVFSVMYFAGCAYLAYLGWQFWQAGSTFVLQEASEEEGKSRPRFLLRGFGSGILNPKNALFYLTLFTVLAGKESSLLERSGAGLWMFCAVLFWDIFIAFSFARVRSYARLQGHLPLFFRGSALILFGIATLMVYAQMA